MHRCLLIDEILHIIAVFLLEDVYPLKNRNSNSVKRGNSNLIVFIVACRTFCEPGLDVLWKSLPDPLPLVHLFPNMYTLSPDRDEGTHIIGAFYDSDHDGLDSEASVDGNSSLDGQASDSTSNIPDSDRSRVCVENYSIG